jgi:hypothetical protein
VKHARARRLPMCHAEIAGVRKEDIAGAWEGLFRDRPFASRDILPEWALRIWEKRCPTPLALHPDYLPAYAISHLQQSLKN